MTRRIDPPTRRAVLTSAALGATAAVGIPAVSVALSPGEAEATPIAKLWQTLGPVAAEHEACRRREEAAWETYTVGVPPVPEALHLDSDTIARYNLTVWEREDGGRTWLHAGGWRNFLKEHPFCINEAFLARCQRTLPLAEQYEAECAVALTTCGLQAAEETEIEARDRRREVEDAILQEEAETFADLLRQAKICDARGCAAGVEARSLVASIRAIGVRLGADV